jgi:hypothetical protein
MNLPVAGEGRVFPLSYQQQTLLTVEMFQPEALFSPGYTIHLALRLRGPLSLEVLEAAFGDVVRRHSALRTRLALGADGELVQEELDLPAGSPRLLVTEGPADPDKMHEVVDRLLATPVPPAEPPMARLAVHRLAPEDALVALCLHHVTSDATGLFLAAQDLARAYGARLAGGSLPPLPLSYGEYSAWLLEKTAARYAQDCAAWRQRLEGVEPYEVRTDQPFQPRSALPPGTFLRRQALDGAAFRQLQRLAWTRRTTPFALLLAAFQVAMGARSRSEDRLAATYFDQRDHPHVSEMIGYFLRPTVIRCPLRDAEPLSDQLPLLTRRVLEAYERAYVPLGELIAGCPQAVPGMVGQAAPWLYVVQYLTQPLPQALRFGEASAELLRSGAAVPQEPGMSLRLRGAEDGGLALRLGYDPALWGEASMRALADRYAGLLREIARDPARTPARLLEAAGGAW